MDRCCGPTSAVNAASSPAAARASRPGGSAAWVIARSCRRGPRRRPAAGDVSGGLAGHPDYLAVRVREEAKCHARHCRGRLDDTPPVGRCRFQCGSHVLDAHEERHECRPALQRADPPGHGTLDTRVDVGVAGSPPVRISPAEELSVKRPRRVGVGRPDLEVDHGMTHHLLLSFGNPTSRTTLPDAVISRSPAICGSYRRVDSAERRWERRCYVAGCTEVSGPPLWPRACCSCRQPRRWRTARRLPPYSRTSKTRTARA